jgi:NADPH-dependent 2,4-dienoyl-CoA reductase/sulfur reductase-like enzyme
VYVEAEEAALKSGRRKCGPPFKRSSAGDKVVVVGGGSGAVGVVEGLRNLDYPGPIQVISSEGYLPIDRPKLSKALIADPAKVALRDEAFYKDAGVEFVQDEVVGVDFANKVVNTKSTAFPYHTLVLATGGTPRNLPLPGFKTLGSIFTMRTVHDVKAIVDAIGDGGKKIVVVGSSFIGMEVANATCGKNTVSVVGMEKVPLERVMGDKVGAGLQTGLEGKGVHFYMSAMVDKAEPSAADPTKVGAVLLKDGTSLAADLVILGVGVAPATGFLRDNDAVALEKDGSLKTDESFKVAGLENVYAVGDIATYPYHGPGGEGALVRIEHWNVAQNAGRSVASTIAGRESKSFIPVFWSALTGQLRYCGNTMNGWDDLVLHGDPAANKFVAYYCKGETVVAVASMGMDPTMVQSSELLRLGKMPSRRELAGGLDVMSLGAPGA